jgi:hypothetical protein
MSGTQRIFAELEKGFSYWARQNHAPKKDIHIMIPKCNVNLHDSRTSWGSTSFIIQVHSRVIMRKRGRFRIKKDVNTEAEHLEELQCWFWREVRGQNQRKLVVSRSWKGKGKDFSPEQPVEVCMALDFSSFEVHFELLSSKL